MIGITIMGRRQMKMLKRRNAAEHRKHHLQLANDIRAKAEDIKRSMTETLDEVKIKMNSLEYREAVQHIDNVYNNLLAEAIAEENRKCMDGEH